MTTKKLIIRLSETARACGITEADVRKGVRECGKIGERSVLTPRYMPPALGLACARTILGTDDVEFIRFADGLPLYQKR